MKLAQLLLVEDDEDNLEVLTIQLSQKYRVLGCRSAAQALKALDTVKPDLLVLDIAMSPVDGLECLDAIRAMPGCSDIPALALTALARDIDRKAFLAHGFQAVVTKPILDGRTLTAVIDALLTSAAARHRGAEASEPDIDDAATLSSLAES